MRDPALAVLLVALLIIAWSMSELIGGTVEGAAPQPPVDSVTWDASDDS